MQNILSLTDLNQQLEAHEQVALLLFNPEDESSRSAFRQISESTYLSEKTPVFVADIHEVIDLQSHFQVSQIPSLLFFVKGKLAEVVRGGEGSDLVKALNSHQLVQP
ncbi:MAG TPA: hypothetical protein VGK10_12180 [Prolixibacteraceae bacterium]|jgi:hypothetical protein